MVNKCVVMAYGVHETGRREILGIDVGEAETEAFWREFLKSLSSKTTKRFKDACYARRCPDVSCGGESRALRARGERPTR